jgi:hypothetical protein
VSVVRMVVTVWMVYDAGAACADVLWMALTLCRKGKVRAQGGWQVSLY